MGLITMCIRSTTMVKLPTLSCLITVLVVTFMSIACFLLSLVAYRLWFHPLASVPGPRLAACSNIWYAIQVRNGRMLQLGTQLHKQYGPAVRVGPNEIWFNSKDAFARIYHSSNGFEKSNFYLATALHKPRLDKRMRLFFPDSLDLLSEQNMDRYRLQRRLIGPLYGMSNLLKYEEVIDQVLREVVSHLQDLDGAEVDLKEWMHIITVECLSAVTLSWSPGYLRAGSDMGSGSHAYIGWRLRSVFGLFPWATILGSYSRSFKRFFERLWALTFEPPKGFRPFFPYVHTKGLRRIAAALRPKPPNDDRRDLTADLIQLHKAKAEFKQTYLKRMITTNFGAGHETTTASLTAIVAMVGSNPHVQSRLQTEISAQSAKNLPVAYSDTSRMPYLQAVVKESQRLYPVLGMSPSRKVPEGGMHLHGHYLPSSTTVGCNPISLHRNPELFGGDAEAFDPERWLRSEGVKDMDRYNLTWGGGPRTCPGRNLAQLMIYKIVSTLLLNFHVEVTMPPDHETKFYFMAMLTSVKLCLHRR